MASVGQVEDITIALRIEHDGVLVGLCHDGHQLLDDGLLLSLGILVLFLKIEMIAGKLCTKHVERGVKVGLFEYGMAWQQKCYPHQGDYQ